MIEKQRRKYTELNSFWDQEKTKRFVASQQQKFIVISAFRYEPTSAHARNFDDVAYWEILVRNEWC